MLLIPPGADLSGKTKYPLLVDVYGGPNSYSVTSSWSIGWGHHMSSNRSVIYAKIDGRGSGLRGDKLLFQIYRKLGTFEIEDQITTAKKLSEKLPFVDPARAAIWGWSYGGYASAMALAKDANRVFKCAVSVAPVTDWTFYGELVERLRLSFNFIMFDLFFFQIPSTPSATWGCQRRQTTSRVTSSLG